ncbi:hypothetical protein [Acinetobacter guillouiae]|uniref:hypothetical protein n=1 Tax=Acinetobacter guillouiae TaxID=106649 RepID=UPI00300B41DC
MPKFSCACGNDINLSTGASSSERVLILENQMNLVSEYLEQDDLTDEKYFDTLLHKAHYVVFCEVCKRIHLDNGDGTYTSYMKYD